MNLKEFISTKNKEIYELKEKLIVSIDKAIKSFDWSLARPEWFVLNTFYKETLFDRQYVNITTAGLLFILRSYDPYLVEGYWDEIRYMFLDLKERNVIDNYGILEGPNYPFFITLKV